MPGGRYFQDLLDEARGNVRRRVRKDGVSALYEQLEQLRDILSGRGPDAFAGRAFAGAIALAEELLERIPQKDRILALWKMGTSNYIAIAEAVGTSASTVRSEIAKHRKKLVPKLEEKPLDAAT